MKLLKKVAKLSKEEKYLLTCSYGPDSMALFHYLLINGYNFEVAHVNYHILEQADDDEKGIREFASKYNIKVHVLETHMPKGVNEEIWAREIRYEYFVKLAKELNIKYVLVAHNEGDYIETYLLQKNRGGIYLKYGLEKETKREGVVIYRPLLNITKKELENYCLENNIPYSIDPSNFDTKFQRNKIRHDIKDFNKEEINKIKLEIKEKNLQNLTILRKYKSLGLPNKINTLSILFSEIKLEEFHLLLIYLIKKAGVFCPLSEGRVRNFLEIIKVKLANYREPLTNEYALYFEYGVVSIKKLTKPYSIKVSSTNDLNHLFSINVNSKDFSIIKNEFPIFIKPAIEGVKYQKNDLTYKVNRQFIAWKMPLSIRNAWPGVFNNVGTLLYVPRYQKRAKKGGLLIFDLNELIRYCQN